MALFSSRRSQPAPAQQPQQDPNVGRNRSMFGRRNRSNDYTDDQYANNTRRSSSSSGGRGLFSNRNKAESVTLARNKVREAEQAEKLAEQHLQAARESVREAKQHVDLVEREANEDARQAAIKQQAAKGLRKDTKGLGRF